MAIICIWMLISVNSLFSLFSCPCRIASITRSYVNSTTNFVSQKMKNVVMTFLSFHLRRMFLKCWLHNIVEHRRKSILRTKPSRCFIFQLCCVLCVKRVTTRSHIECSHQNKTMCITIARTPRQPAASHRLLPATHKSIFVAYAWLRYIDIYLVLCLNCTRWRARVHSSGCRATKTKNETKTNNNIVFHAWSFSIFWRYLCVYSAQVSLFHRSRTIVRNFLISIIRLTICLYTKNKIAEKKIIASSVGNVNQSFVPRR